MAEEQEQTVVDQTNAETQQSSVAEGGAQGDDLDSLLDQWEKGSQGEDSQESDKGGQFDSTDDPKQKITQIEQYLRRQEEERAQEEISRDLKSTATKMKEAVAEEAEISEDVFEDLLHGRAARDSRVLNAWNSRKKDPKSWDKTATAMAREFVKRLKSDVDKNATEDRDAVASAVASASKTPPADDGPSEEDLTNMSDAEFNKLTRSMR